MNSVSKNVSKILHVGSLPDIGKTGAAPVKFNKVHHHLSQSTAATQPTEDAPSAKVPSLGLLADVKDREGSGKNDLQICLSQQDALSEKSSEQLSSNESGSDSSSYMPLRRGGPTLKKRVEVESDSSAGDPSQEEASPMNLGVPQPQSQANKLGNSKSARPVGRVALQSQNSAQIFWKQANGEAAGSLPIQPPVRRISDNNVKKQWGDSPLKRGLSMVIDTTSLAPSHYQFEQNLTNMLLEEDEACGPKEKRIREFLSDLKITQVDFKEYLKDQQQVQLRSAFLSHMDGASSNDTQVKHQSLSRQSSLFTRRIKNSGLDFSARCNSASLRLKSLAQSASAMHSQEKTRPTISVNGPSPNTTSGGPQVPQQQMQSYQMWPDHSDKIFFQQKPIVEQEEPEATPLCRLGKVNLRLGGRRTVGLGGLTPDDPISGNLFRHELDSPLSASDPEDGKVNQ